MICFKDHSFCSADCKTFSCWRHFTDELHQQAREWWKHDMDNAPVAFMDFSADCESYQPIGGVK